MAAHTYNLALARAKFLRPSWSIEFHPGQLGLQGEHVSKNWEKKNGRKKRETNKQKIRNTCIQSVYLKPQLLEITLK